MELNVICPIIIAFSGFPIGMLLAKISPEEMKTGQKYFNLIKSFLIAFTLFFFLQYYQINIIIVIVASIIIFLLNLYLRINVFIFYALFALILYFTQSNMFYFAIISSLIFLFGLPSGSLKIKLVKKFKDKK